MIDRYTDSDGNVIESEVKPDDLREVAVGRVASLNPARASLGGRVFRVHARTVGLTVAVGDWVLLARVEQGVVVVAKVEVL